MLPLLLSSPAAAHEVGLSAIRVTPDELEVVFARAEVDASFPVHPRLTVDGAPCTFGAPEVVEVEEDGLAFTFPAQCPPGDSWTLQAPWLATLPSSHLAVVELHGTPAGLMTADQTTLTFGQATAGEIAADFVGLGVEHVLTGFDHLAFLFGLLLITRSLKEIVGIVTGFTVAHSLTLSLAALGVVSLPESLVEPAIALSVAWVGLENRYDPPPRRRLLLTFALGLIHGFGFAGLLHELGLPAQHTALALVGFNLGVEIGQIGLVLLTLPLLLRLRGKEAWRERWVPGLSWALVAVGLFWFIERIAWG